MCLLLAISLPALPAKGQDFDALKALMRTSAATPKREQRVASPIPLVEALETKGDLSLQDATMEKALFTIGASWRVNIVVGKDVQGTVSCIYKQTRLREVLDAILLANGYSYRAVGDSLVVQKTQEVGSANPLFDNASITVTHGDLGEILEGARMLLSNQGEIRSVPSAKSLLVIDYEDRVKSIRDFVSRMDAAASRSTGGIPAEIVPTAGGRLLQIAVYPSRQRERTAQRGAQYRGPHCDDARGEPHCHRRLPVEHRDGSQGAGTHRSTCAPSANHGADLRH